MSKRDPLQPFALPRSGQPRVAVTDAFSSFKNLRVFLGAAPGGDIDSRLRKSVDPPRRVTFDHVARRTWQGIDMPVAL
jgi:hypothetical protein